MYQDLTTYYLFGRSLLRSWVGEAVSEQQSRIEYTSLLLLGMSSPVSF